MVIYGADSGGVDIVNSRERASRNAEAEQFLDDDGEEVPFADRIQTGEAMGVPESARETTSEWGLVWGDEEVQGKVQVIRRDGDELIGAADPRRDGQATGFDRAAGGGPDCA
jgi:gamma-glutamyltranspeptidase / glutathione hydrolase